MISSVAASVPPRVRQEALGEWGGTVMFCLILSCHYAFPSVRFPLLVLLGSFPFSIPLSPPPSLSSLYVPFLLPAVPHSPNSLI